MNIVWFSWKDISHPAAGGAETVSNELRKHLARDGHKVTLITATYPGSKGFEQVDGVDIYRTGNRYTVYLNARRLYKNNLRQNTDLVIDEMNTIPFLAPMYTKKSTRSYLLTYQLARNVWFHQMIFPLSIIGYMLEPIYLRFMSKKYDGVITESNSTKADLMNYGFRGDDIAVFRIGMDLKPTKEFEEKKDFNTVVFLGAFRKMKRTLDAIKAFEIAKDYKDSLRMIVIGDNSGSYGKKVLNYIAGSRHSSSINILGRVSLNEKNRQLRLASVILVTSVKEGWGLIITEANSQGTPAIAYDVDGLRDSINNGKTGVLVGNGMYKEMAEQIVSITNDPEKLELFAKDAWSWSKEFTFDNSYSDFKKILKLN